MDSIGLKRGTVVLKSHHQEWAASFEQEKEALNALLGDAIIDIQHVGSTAIPHLVAKPIIDMLIAVRSLPELVQGRKVLEAEGYEYRENGSDDIQKLFVKGPEENRTHYLHFTELGSGEWRNSIAFRDYLRSHPDEMRKYADLKQKLAAQYPDNRGKYTEGKKAYFEEVFAKAIGRSDTI